MNSVFVVGRCVVLPLVGVLSCFLVIGRFLFLFYFFHKEMCCVVIGWWLEMFCCYWSMVWGVVLLLVDVFFVAWSVVLILVDGLKCCDVAIGWCYEYVCLFVVFNLCVFYFRIWFFVLCYNIFICGVPVWHTRSNNPLNKCRISSDILNTPSCIVRKIASEHSVCRFKQYV